MRKLTCLVILLLLAACAHHEPNLGACLDPSVSGWDRFWGFMGPFPGC